jgi:predicted dehydrogenase
LIRIAVAGAGEWGRNHVRALASLPGVDLAYVADPSADARRRAAPLAPRARLVDDAGAALRDPRLDALVVASPSPSHGPLARAALAAGKHVLVEKPLAPTAEEAWDLVRRAKRARRLLVVGHLLLHHPAVRRLRRLVDAGTLGRIHYIVGQRTNLGRIRTDESSLLSLAPHDVSVMVHLLGAWPVAVGAQGAACVQPTWEDVVFLTLRFPGGTLGHVHVSWLDPHKVRRISLVGERRMVVFDDMEPAEKLRLHDKSAVPPGVGTPPAPGALAVRSGRTRVLRVPLAEPLREELRAFCRAVRGGRPTITPGSDGARVMEVLEAAQLSMRRNGETVPVRP